MQRERKLRNDKYDEAVDVSQSMDKGAPTKPHGGAKSSGGERDSKGNGDAKGGGGGAPRGLTTGSEQTKSQSILNRPFDEALEFSHSGSDESVDTKASDKKNAGIGGSDAKGAGGGKGATSAAGTLGAGAGAGGAGSTSVQPHLQQMQQTQGAASQKQQATGLASKPTAVKRNDDDSGESGDGDQGEESYDNIEGAYNPKDYDSLNVAAEVRDLFQYIERYKPQEVDLDTTLKCFIPEYIPAIGEMDAFIKVPRPDGTEDDLGLKFLDEPSASQSDPTVLELQLRAMSKKLQYGDVVVRSIDNAAKNPAAIEKWIQSINDLHRSKPPPQVHYRRNMPDVDTLLDVWPEEFEAALQHLHLPSPDLELSLSEYVKVICTILDIPVYENPIESLHVMFSLYMDFRNNPHFQSRFAGAGGNRSSSELDSERDRLANYGGADVMEIIQGK